jgi:hypothetical protein
MFRIPDRVPPWACALVGACYALAVVINAELLGPLGSLDFDAAWSAARALLAHQNPYAVIGPSGAYHYPWPFVYPLTAGVVALPLAPLPVVVARVLFLAISGGVFCYAVGARRPWAWPILISAPLINALMNAQWASLLAASLLLPAWGIVGAVKPNVALALLAGARSRRHAAWIVGGGLVILAVSVALRPSWPWEWTDRLREARDFGPLFSRPGGFLVLAGLLRWRDGDARLLVGLGLVPTSGFWYEMLPAMLVARNYRESLILAVCSVAAFIGSGLITPGEFTIERNQIATLVLWGCLLPPLVLVLLRGRNRAGPAAGGSAASGA